MIAYPLCASAQPPESAQPSDSAQPSGSVQLSEAWSRTFGGPSSDPAGSVAVTADGGYILTGMTLSKGSGQGDIWLVKTDKNGTEEWNKTFGGPKMDIGRSVIQAMGGGYVIAGSTKSSGAGNTDAWLVKTDENGTESWNRTFGSRSADDAASVKQTADGGYILAGYTSRSGNNDLWLIRTDKNGTEEWNRTIGGPGNEEANSVAETADGGYILAGKTNSYGFGRDSEEGYADAWLVKTDGNGTEQWNIPLGGNMVDEAHSAIQTMDGGYVLTGCTNAMLFADNPASEILVAKARHNGTLQWQMSFGEPNRNEGQAVQQVEDGGYLVSGYTNSYGDSEGDALVAGISPAGEVVWTKAFGGIGSQSPTALIRTEDGYVIAGSANRPGAYDLDFWLQKLLSSSKSGEGITSDEKTTKEKG